MFRYTRFAVVLAAATLLFAAASFRVGVEAQNADATHQDTSVPPEVRFEILHPIDRLPRLRLDKFTGDVWWLESDVRDPRWRPIAAPIDSRRVAGALTYRLYPAPGGSLPDTVLLNVHTGDAWILRQRAATTYEWQVIATAAR